MKIITIILIVLLAFVSIFFGVILIKKAINAREITPVGAIDTGTKETSASDTTSIQGTSESAAEETSTETTPETLSENIEKIEIYLDGNKENGVFLGEADMGLPSNDAAQIYGEDFANYGFDLKNTEKKFIFEPATVHSYYIYLFIPAHGWEYVKKEFTVPGDPVTSESIRMSIDSIADNETIAIDNLKDVRVSGWAADTSANENTGINKVEVFLDGPSNFGKLLGQAQYGLERVDVGNAYGNPNYNPSGFSFSFDATSLEHGSSHKIYVYAYSPKGTHQYLTRNITIEGSAKETNSIISANVNVGLESIEIKGWAINKNFIKEGIPRSTDTEYAVKKIVFVSNKSGNEDIFSMNLDGSELTQLTDDPGSDQYPSASPDGKKIAYSATIGGTWQIVVMNWDGSEKQQITSGPYRHGFPSWSFDGKYIFFEMYIDENWEIYRMDSDGSNLKRLTKNPGIDDWHPGAHPFEYKVIYESGPSGSEDIYMIDANGENMKKITKSDRRYRVPKFLIDGSKIIFMGFDNNNLPQVFMIDTNGENISQITSSPGGAGIPSPSPDNKFIAYNGNPSGSEDIFIMNIDGSGQVQLTNIPGDDWGPVFLYQTK
jgi:TolB protein